MPRTTKQTLKFRIEGKDVSPETVRLKDLYEVLVLLEGSFAATAKSRGATDQEDLTISLAGIDRGSNLATLAMSEPMYVAAGHVAESIANDDYNRLPPQAQANLRTLWNRSKTKSWQFDIYDGDNGTFPRVVITPQHEILPPGDISGGTTLYGKLERIGGMNPPTAWLTLISGQHVVVTLKSTDMASDLSPMLYDIVGLEGEAIWDMDDWSLRKFRASAVSEYRDTDAVTAFANLSEVAGDFWDDVNPSDYVTQLRVD